MTTDPKPTTPPDELRAAAGTLRRDGYAWPPVMVVQVADWLDAVAKMWDDLIESADAYYGASRAAADSLRTGPWDAQHALGIARSINGPEIEAVPGHALESLVQEPNDYGWKATCTCSYWVVNRTPGTRAATVERFRRHITEAVQ